METIKNVLGLGGSAPTSKEESLPDQHPLSGEEPVSGQLGAGTATDPYDAGNADGQSGSAAGQSPGNLPKASTSPESPKDDNTSSLNPKELTTSSTSLEPSLKTQEDFNSSPGLQGHPLSITSFTPTPTAEDFVSPYSFTPARDTVPVQDIVSAPEALPAHVDEQTQPEDTQPPGHVPEGSPDTAINSDIPQQRYLRGTGESKPFVEQEAARIAKETAPRDTPEETGPSIPATNTDTDRDLAESTKKMHLKDKIKEKLHFRKKSEDN